MIEGQPNKYLGKHQLAALQINEPPENDLSLVVVIPCRDEPKLLDTLACLWHCQRPRGAVEIIIVINASGSAPASVQRRNQQTLTELLEWVCRHQDPRLKFHSLFFPDLPSRHAGVGLARKLGMDEAVARFAINRHRDGLIVCLDADCRCQLNYLQALETHFETHPQSPACSIHFEHPISGEGDAHLYEGIVGYELFLRYYLLGLRYARFPHAFHTVGSSMAVRTWVYEKQGGMNRRQAGEDFYFLGKIIRFGRFTELRNTTVMPSPRASGRVPFGTGKTMQRWMAGENPFQRVYAPGLFDDLRQLFSEVPNWFHCAGDLSQTLDGLPQSIVSYLHEVGFDRKIEEIRRNVARIETFMPRFFRWFDAFRIYKYIRWAHQHYHPGEPLELAVGRLLEWQGALPSSSATSSRDLLIHMRALDRSGRFCPAAVS